MSRSPEGGMIISWVKLGPSLRSIRGTVTAGVLGGGVDSSAGGELVLEGEESWGYEAWYCELLGKKFVVMEGGG